MKFQNLLINHSCFISESLLFVHKYLFYSHL
nr:MAG TPA: hypothetical protein [Caudoviricetes sp.]